jgi:PKD repeat protein
VPGITRGPEVVREGRTSLIRSLVRGFSNAALAAGIVAAGVAVAAGMTFHPTLLGAREPGGGDGAGTGLAVISVDPTAVSYYFWVKGITLPTAAHVHVGRAGVSGGIVVDLGAVTWSNPTAGIFIATGSVSASSSITSAILADPSNYYVNVHNSSFPGGAMRGQLLGDGPAASALATSLLGSREPTGGDPQASGAATVLFDGGTTYYYVRVSGLTGPTAAHVHIGPAGQNGGIVVDLSASFTSGVATGNASSNPSVTADILAHPDQYYVNVHSGAFPVGAARGQLAQTESLLHVPVLAHNAGLNGAFFKTDVRILNLLSDELAPTYLEWYPHGAAGSMAPGAVAEVDVAARGTALLDDAAAALFSATNRGAIRILSASPILAVARNYNDQTANSKGTFGQFEQGLGGDRALTSGALLLNSNRPAADLQDFRTNVGYFNASPSSVTVTFDVRSPDGTLVATPGQLVIPAWANEQGLFHDTIPGIPAEQQTLANFYITFTATSPIFIFSSVVDNVSGDGLHQPAIPIPNSGVSAVNHPPDGTISSPTGNVGIQAGQAVSFAGTVSDPDGDSVTVAWDFGDGSSSTQLAPGSHTYATAGVFNVTFTATDVHGLPDPSPDTRTITVTAPGPGNRPPKGTIVSPAHDELIYTGASANFTGSTSDPDGDPVTVVWDFGDGTTSTDLSPGYHEYDYAGSYTVIMTATDSHGVADPAPPQRIINVYDYTYPYAPPTSTTLALPITTKTGFLLHTGPRGVNLGVPGDTVSAGTPGAALPDGGWRNLRLLEHNAVGENRQSPSAVLLVGGVSWLEERASSANRGVAAATSRS